MGNTDNNRDLVTIDVEIADAARRHAKHKDDPVSSAFNEVTMNKLLDERFEMSPTPTAPEELERILSSVK